MMKKSLIVFIVLTISGVQLAYSQYTIKGEKGVITKQATIRVSELEQEGPPDSPLFKAPNKNWAPPQWDVDENDVIYLESEGIRNSATRSVTENSPAPDTSFRGLDDTGNSIPPDVNGAAGPNHIMTTLNTQVRVQDKEGNNLFTTHLGNFWKSIPFEGGTFDPKILYDPYEERWIMVTCNGSNPAESKLYFGASVTSDPLGEWYLYWLDPDLNNITWFDYPSIGFNNKWITISGNMFGGAYYRTVFAIDKLAVYNGNESPNHTRFATSEAFTLVPSITYDPDMEDMYLISTSSGNSGGYGYIKKFKLSGDVNDPVFEYEGAIGVPEPWENGAGNSGNFLPQLGSSEKINSVDSRMENVIYRNGKLWAVHHIFLPVNNPQRAAVQLWELDIDGTVLNRYRIQDTTNLFSFAFPTVAVNANEDIMVGHNVFSSTQYAGAGYSFKSYADEGNAIRTYYQYKDGENPYYKTFGGSRNRWGDYSATCVDPTNDYDFWVIQEYAASPQNNWGTWWAYLKPTFSPIANFTSDEVLIPTGETVGFTDLTEGVPSAWSWTFEGGTPATSNEQNPTGIQFAQEGTFNVTLIVTNELGADTIVKEAYITTSSSLLPDIEFSVSTSSICIGGTASFEDKSINSPNQWDWQLNPGTVIFVNETDQSSQNPVVVFEEAGVYSLTLTVGNLNGTVDTIAYDIMVVGGYMPYYKETFEVTQFSLNSWTVENPDDDVTWELFEVGGTGPGNTAAGIDFTKYFKIGERDRLISPSFNLTGLSGAALEFKHAYAKRNDAYSDSLIIYVSGSCGEDWTRVYANAEDGSGNFATHEKTDSFWPEYLWDWCGTGYGASCISIDLTPWVGQTDVRIAFETWSAFGNPLFIDNVQISQYVGVEVSISDPDEISIYPNPTNGTFYVDLKVKESFNEMSIFNHMGQIIQMVKIDPNAQSIEVRLDVNQEPGIYFVRLNGEQQTITKRIVVY